MQDDGVIYVAGHPLLDWRCTRVCQDVSVSEMTYIVSGGVYAAHSLTGGPLTEFISSYLIALVHWNNQILLLFLRWCLSGGGATAALISATVFILVSSVTGSFTVLVHFRRD